ncbi:CDC5- kinase involved in regulation of DNA replication [Fusarium agapanthi]|uniref:non-specific serine/threonine protein kinase n=1 Tax=Fusarium agapanthi TaxID=1803897 RepID=A0A9P5BIK8_9HYPO|nr:CDC5- kinase involved in regulation of DNA replication [Fusarium agapanthi]
MSITAWTDEDVRAALVPQNEFPTCSYRRGTRLGRGAGASVYKVLNVKTGGLFAGKVSPQYADHLREEARNLTRLNHPHIVKFIEYCEDKHSPAAGVLVIELCAGGSLQDKIHDNSRGLKGEETLQVMLQVGRAVEYLHGEGLFHTDIKPRNIFIRSWSPVDVVLGDCAEVMKVEHIDPHQRPYGTRSYWSPYMEKYGRNCGKSDDIWALGISLLGTMAQWPRCLVKQEKLYPSKCFNHARELHKLNPDDDRLKILLRLLGWDHHWRITASQLVKLICERLEARPNFVEELKSPEGFQPLVFW